MVPVISLNRSSMTFSPPVSAYSLTRGAPERLVSPGCRARQRGPTDLVQRSKSPIDVEERSSRVPESDAGSSRRPSRGIREPLVRLLLNPATGCRRLPRRLPPLLRANRGHCPTTTSTSGTGTRARTALSCLTISSNVRFDHCRTTRSSAVGSIEPREHLNRPHRERHDPDPRRPDSGQLGGRRNQAIDIGFAAVCRGQPADRNGCQRVAARRDRDGYRSGMDKTFGNAAQANPAQQSRRRRPDNNEICVVSAGELDQTGWDRGRLVHNGRHIEVIR